MAKEKLEALAQGLAAGMDPVSASTAAGYVGGANKRLTKRLKTPGVVGRVAELRWDASALSLDLGPVIDALMTGAKGAGDLGSAAGFVAMRGMLVEAARLKSLVVLPPAPIRIDPPRSLSEAEWLDRYGPKAAANRP